MTWKGSFLLCDPQSSFSLYRCTYSKMILSLLGKMFEKEKDEKTGNEHFKVEIEICTALPIAEEHTVGDMPLAMGYYVFTASSLFSSHIHSITRFLLGEHCLWLSSLLQGKDITIIPLRVFACRENVRLAQSFKR